MIIFNVSYKEGDGIHEWLVKCANANSFSLDNAVSTVINNGRYWTKSIYKEGSIAPIIKHSFVKDSPHMYFPEQSWRIWDEFFSKYQRNIDMTLSYEGIQLE